MHKLSCIVFCCVLSLHLVNGQFSLPGSSDSSSSYPRIKLAGPLGQLIGGQGISLNSGLGQVLSSIISSAANGGSSNSGGPLSQLATAASTQYINAIRSLPPFNQFGGGGGGGNQQSQQHSQFNAPAGHGHQFNPMQNPINFLSPDSNLYGAQGNFEGGHFAPNSFPHFPSENFFGGGGGGGGQFGGFNHGPSSNPMGSSALYQGGGGYNGHPSGNGHHNLDK